MRILIFLIIFIACVPHEDIPSSDFIEVLVNPTSGVEADGRSKIEITINLDPKVDMGTEVILNTSAGQFLTNMKQEIKLELFEIKNFNGKNYLSKSITLQAPYIFPSTADIYAKVDNDYSKIISIEFQKSLPSSIQLEADKAGAPNTYSEDIVITGKLKSAKGIPSNGTIVDISFLSDEIPTDLDMRKANLGSNENGEISFLISGGGLEAPSILSIVGKIKEQPEICDTLKVNIYKSE